MYHYTISGQPPFNGHIKTKNSPLVQTLFAKRTMPADPQLPPNAAQYEESTGQEFVDIAVEFLSTESLFFRQA